jgi:hypothetical protein
MTSKAARLLLPCCRLNRLFLERERNPGRSPVEDDGRAQVIPIVMEAPQSVSGLDSVGVREDFGVYSELRETAKDKPRMSLPRLGTLNL